MTAPTKSRSFIVQVDNLQDLFEKFDARMGHTQWERYLTQVPGWETARDHEGRTLLMIAFGSTKGRNPDFYLRSAVADALAAIRDGQLEPFIAHQHDRFLKHIIKGREDILSRDRNRLVERADIHEAVAQIRQARLEQRLTQADELPSRKPRL